MKAQRRQQLKANSLIWTLQGLPETIKRYQSQIALVLVLIALAIVMIRYRMTAAEQRLLNAQQSLSVANEQLHRLQSSRLYPGADALGYMKQRMEFYSDGLQQADDALQKAPDSQPALKAEALLVKGDINFEIANAPEMPGAATQPALRPAESVENLLNNAHDAYMQVLENYSDQKFAVTAAHFGLAAVAEDRAVLGNGDSSQWDAAKVQYQAIVDSDAEPGYKAIATQRIQLLPQLERPVAIGLSATTVPSPLIGPLGPTTQK
jgi:hypothetical protein